MKESFFLLKKIISITLLAYFAIFSLHASDSCKINANPLSNTYDDLQKNYPKWCYDPDKRLMLSLEAADTPYKQTASYFYDASGKLEKIIKPSGVVIDYKYTASGQLQNYCASDLSFNYFFVYDDQGYLIQIEDLLHRTKTVRTFNADGQILVEKLGNGLSLKNSYDTLGRKTIVTLPDTSSINYSYDSFYLRKIERYSSDNQLNYCHTYEEYDVKENPKKITLIGATGELSLHYADQGTCHAISSPHWDQQISKESLHNICFQSLQGVDSQGYWESTFSYNDSQEIINESGAFIRNYSYDDNHNRIETDDFFYEYNALNQLIKKINAQETVEYHYDLNGNLIKKYAPTQTTNYHYDALDRLITVEIENALSLQFTYDAFDRRLSKIISKWDPDSSQWILSKTHNYLYDEDREMGVVDNQGNVQELRIFGISLIKTSQQTEISAAIAHEIDGRCYAPIHDHRGNIRCLIDAQSGKVAESYRYSAFGELEIYAANGTILEKSAIDNPWLFSSKRRDSETGLIFYGKRYYEPTVGRWITKDPLGSFDGNNPYHFLHNNPLFQIDPYGLFSLSISWQDVKGMADTFAEALFNFKNTVSYATSMQNELDEIAEKFIGIGFLRLFGYYCHPLENGCTTYGQELHEKVRVTFINGILNTRSDLEEALQLLSTTHNNIPIHYVYRPTEGWTKDILTSTLSKLGYTSPYAELLAKTWKEKIEEMGGIDQGGKIIHYAHSIGATDTYIAKNLLSLEEQKMIHVVSLGSPTIIPNNSGFGSVVNYVSKRDGVSLLDPIGFGSGYFNETSRIELIGSLWGMPFIDHTLYTDSYGNVLKELGKQFIEMYTETTLKLGF